MRINPKSRNMSIGARVRRILRTPITISQAEGRGGFGGRSAFLFRRCVVWNLASMQSPQKPPQKAEDARHEKSRHGKNRSYDHQGKIIATRRQKAGGVFRGARIVFDADGPAHLDRVARGPYLPV